MDYDFILQDRLQKIKQIISQYGEDNFVLSFSGGKDSTVLHYLIDDALPNNNIQRVFFNTGIEYKKIVEFVKTMANKDNRFVIVPPHVNIKNMLETEGYPFKSKEHSQYLDIYQSHGYTHTKTTDKYANRKGEYNSKYGCNKRLAYQFSPDYHLRISAKCCQRLKKDVSKQWMTDNNKSWTITGIRKDEGGVRRHSDCIIHNSNGGGTFNPLFPIDDDFINEYIEKNNIQLCELYYPPYNFVRTGCAGCPFSIHLQEQLDVLEELLPEEKKKCEIIWKPVYDEYRLINFRLKRQGPLTSIGRMRERRN